MKTSKIIQYLEKIYKKDKKMLIEITKIELKKLEFNRYEIEFEFDYMDGNVEYSNDETMYLDLEKILYFDNCIDWTKNKFYKQKPNN